ncbi:MAG: amylo-alpha-1,6-glucosidase [Acidobacteriota bacterium]
MTESGRSNEPVRRIPWPVPGVADPELLVTREWLVANGLGGYASGTIAGVVTRRYHGPLVAALGAPHGRTVMLSHIAEQVRIGGRKIEIGGRERTSDAPDAQGTGYLVEFRLEAGLPVWRYDVDGYLIEKRVFLPHLQNTVYVMYELCATPRGRQDGPAVHDGDADRIELLLRPSVNFRHQESPVSQPLGSPYQLHADRHNHEIALPGSGLPPLRLVLHGNVAAFVAKEKRIVNILYPVEESRGYQARGDLWSPGYFRLTLAPGAPATLIGSTESWPTIGGMTPMEALEAERSRRRRLLAQAVPEARDGIGAELVLAADQFIIAPVGRAEEEARARAAGDEVRTVIAGYHWFTDWGRDTMISLEGLTLATGRHVEAGYILRTFAHYVRDGLIPNMFPEREKEGLYHTADATLWFFHAISRYLKQSDDQLTLPLLFPTLKAIVAWHVRGTHFGIHVDPHDGLLTQGAAGYQLTWMDAKVDDWVVTPRRGKAVEINALWYNAIRLMQAWAAELGDSGAAGYGAQAEQIYASFNERFWYSAGGYLYDIVDCDRGGDDPKCRPNQVLSIALPHEVLARERWEPVMRTVGEQLATPVGLRSLAPGDPDFQARYYGDLRARDAAYHQGTVWGWLVGPYVDAWLKVYPDDQAGAWQAMEGFIPHLDEACIGSVSEVFDAAAPFTARGCIAQAWSVAELLRIWVELRSRGSLSGSPDLEMASSLPR